MPRHNKNNSAALLIIVMMLGIMSSYVLLNVKWFQPEQVNAAITLGTEIQANSNSAPNTQGSTATAIDAEGNTIVVWSAEDPGLTDTSGHGVYYRRFQSDGTAIDVSDVLVNTYTTNNQIAPQVVMDKDGNFIIVWEGEGSTDTYGIHMQAFDNTGSTVGSETLVHTTHVNTQNQPHIAIDYDGPSTGSATRFAISWTHYVSGSDYDIQYRLFDVDFGLTASPTPVAAESTVNTYTTGNQLNSDVAMNNLGEYIVTWYGPGSGSTGYWYQAYAQNSTLIGTNTKVNDAIADTGISGAATDKMPRPDLDDENNRTFVITYRVTISANNAIAARQLICNDPAPTNGVDTDLTCSLNPSELIANTTLTQSQSDPSVAADYLGNFTVTWNDENAGASGGIMAQSYNYLGKQLGDNFIVNTSAAAPDVVTGAQILPSIGMNTDGFYSIAFTNNNDSENYFQKYTTEIFKVESETLAHTASVNNQALIDSDIAPNGNHVQVWEDVTIGDIRFTLTELDSTNPPTITKLQENITVTATGNVSNPTVSFFKDEQGAGLGKFIVAWETDTGGDNDIYYQLYNADGTTSGGATAINDTADSQEVPEIDAAYYYTGGDDTQPIVQEFSVGYINTTQTQAWSSYYYNAVVTSNSLMSCSANGCDNIEVSMNPANNTAIFAFQDQDASSNINVHICQTTSGALTGSATAVTTSNDSGDPDVAFYDTNKYIVTYTKSTGASTADLYAVEYTFGGSGPTSPGTPFEISRYQATTQAEFAPAVDGDITNTQFLIVWTDIPPVTPTDDHIFGQYFDDDTGTISPFGPTFRINSTQSNNQTVPAIGLNKNGQAIVAWEGEYNQGGTSDSNAVISQILSNPLNIPSVIDLTPLAEQEIEAGAKTLSVPSTITFSDVALDPEDPTVNTVSIRATDPQGGDSPYKYVEVTDASGGDITLTVQVADFYSASDGKSYIKNDTDFRVRNWDQSTTGVDDGPTCTGDPTKCFTTISSSTASTVFELSAATQSYAFADAQVTLAQKNGTTNDNEIGVWRLYPEFEITVPALVAPGAHNAVITFTLT